jgi:hypothetical protein
MGVEGRGCLKRTGKEERCQAFLPVEADLDCSTIDEADCGEEERKINGRGFERCGGQ